MSAEIPYGAYWSTPFARWQGALSRLHSLRFAALVAQRELARRNIDPTGFDLGVLGMTRPEPGCFYGMPWLMGLIGGARVPGPTISQACATGARALITGAHAIDTGEARSVLAVTCDRTSNSPHIYYPDPGGPGGGGASEDFILANIACDPLGSHSMLATAENVAAKYQVGISEQHDVVLIREEQYRSACRDDHSFHRRYMQLPFPLPDARLQETKNVLEGDEGVRFSTREGLLALKPVLDGGRVTYGAQTHPADGNAAIIVARAEIAPSLATDAAVRVRILSCGSSRTALGYMPEAPVEAAHRALETAGLRVADLHAINTHNPFVVNDLVFARGTGFSVEAMNRRGCSLVFGHPVAPTGTRSIIELIEELAERGGGYGMFVGCAAGDSAMAVILAVDSRRA